MSCFPGILDFTAILLRLDRVRSLHNDFNTVNAVLASQVTGVVDDLDELSPALAAIYRVLTGNEIFLIDEAVKTLRDSAWRFATILAL